MHIFFEKTTKFLSFLFTLFSLMLNNNNWLSIHISIVSLVSSSLIAIVVSNVLDNVRTTIGSDVRERAAHCNRLIRFTLTQNLAGHVVFDAVRQLPTANQTNQISKNYKKNVCVPLNYLWCHGLTPSLIFSYCRTRADASSSALGRAATSAMTIDIIMNNRIV